LIERRDSGRRKSRRMRIMTTIIRTAGNYSKRWKKIWQRR
jgi:hypothetical protein